MDRRRRKHIQIELAKLERKRVPDDLISSYGDFLKHRDYLRYYCFNPKVFRALIDLNLSNWHSKDRISRLSLIRSIKRHGFRDNKWVMMNGEIRDELFRLFQYTFDLPEGTSSEQTEAIRNTGNSLIYGMELNDEQVEWLCDHAGDDNRILNRVLRYPKRSQWISEWAKGVYEVDIFRPRRAELVGRILDVDPSFRVRRDSLFRDFEYLNDCDQKEILASRAAKLLQDKEDIGLELSDDHIYKYGFDFPVKLAQRPYDMTKVRDEELDAYIPDFEQSRKVFREQIYNHLSRVMIWAVYYSHLPMNTKVKLIKENHSSDFLVEHAVMVVAKRLGSKGLWRWLMKNA